MTTPVILAAIVIRLESSHTCLHPVTTGQPPVSSDALYRLAQAMLQIHNSTEDGGTRAIAATALKAIEGGT